MGITLNSLIRFVKNNPSIPEIVGAYIITRALNSRSEWPLQGPLPNGDHVWIYRAMSGSQPLFDLFNEQHAEQLTPIEVNGHDSLDLPGLLDALFAGNPPSHLRETEPDRFTYDLRLALMERRLALSTTVRFVDSK